MNEFWTERYLCTERRDWFYCTMQSAKKDRDKDSLAALEASYQQRHVCNPHLSKYYSIRIYN